MNPETPENEEAGPKAFRQQILEATIQAEGNYRLLFENNPLPMWVVDRASLAFLAANNAAAYNYGYSKEEYLKMIVTDLHPREDRPRVHEILSGTLPIYRHTVDMRHVKKGGEIIDVEVTAHELNLDGKSARLAVAFDVTERSRAQGKLQLCEDILKNIQIAACILRLETPRDLKSFRIIMANPAAARLIGASPGDFEGTALMENFPALFETELPEIYAEVIRSGAARDLEEFRYGDERIPKGVFAVKVFPLPNDSVGVAFENITKSKQSETTLRESEERSRALIEGVKDYAIIMLDPAGRVVSWNAGAERILAYRAEEILGQRCSCFYPPDQPQQQKEEHELNVAAAQGRYEDEGWRLRKDGSLLWATVVTTALRDETGNLRGFAKIMRDITEQRRAAIEIAILAKFPDENSMPVLRIGRDGVILYANKGSDSLLSGWHCRRGGSLPEHSRRVAAQAMGSGKAQQAEVECAGRIIALSFMPVLDAGYVNVYGHDITEQKRLETEILEVSERERRQVGQDLHDGLSQEISGIAYMVNGLHKKLVQASAAEAADTQMIAEHVNLAKHQTRDLARLLNPISLQAEGLMVALNHLATSITAMFKVSCRFKCAPLVLVRDPKASIHLFRIAQEAVSNAVRHGQANHIVIGLHQTKDNLVLTVRNNGAVFLRADPGNRGMGLHIMHSRAQAIGAILDIRPDLREGMVLTCSLPLSRLT